MTYLIHWVPKSGCFCRTVEPNKERKPFGVRTRLVLSLPNWASQLKPMSFSLFLCKTAIIIFISQSFPNDYLRLGRWSILYPLLASSLSFCYRFETRGGFLLYLLCTIIMVLILTKLWKWTGLILFTASSSIWRMDVAATLEEPDNGALEFLSRAGSDGLCNTMVVPTLITYEHDRLWSQKDQV